MTNPNDKWVELLRLVEATAENEIDCDEMLSRLGAYLESLEAPGRTNPKLDAVAQHLQVCGECSEELEALLNIYGIEAPEKK